MFGELALAITTSLELLEKVVVGVLIREVIVDDVGVMFDDIWVVDQDEPRIGVFEDVDEVPYCNWELPGNKR